MNFDRTKVVAAFLAESEEGLDQTEQHLIAAETDPGNLELLDEMFRVAHTIKGNASALDFPELAGFAHVMEDLLEAVRKHELAISRELISLLLQAVDALRVLIPAAAQGNDQLSPAQIELKRIMANRAAGQDAPVHTDANRSDEMFSPKAVPGSALPFNARNRTLRVDIEKLDQMLSLTGEIAIAQGRLRRMIDELKTDSGRKLLEVQREIESLQKDLQEQVMGVRLVPVGPLFQQFARSVRDMSQSHEKLARLEIVGADVEVDTRVLEHLNRLWPGRLVKKPAATGVHQHQVPLQFEQAQSTNLFDVRQTAKRMPTQEISRIRSGSIENGNYVFVSSQPRVLQKLLCASFIIGNEIIPQPIKRRAQGPPPLLIPAGTASCVAAAIGLPAADAVGATPGSLLLDSNFLRRRMQSEVLAIIGQAGEFIFLNVLESVCKRHVAVRMMMTVGLAVSGNMHQLRRVAFGIEMTQQTSREILAAEQ